MGNLSTEDFKLETKQEVHKAPDGTTTTTTTTTTTVGTEDIFAGIGGLVAVVLTLGIIFGKFL